MVDSPKGQAFSIDAIWLDGLDFRDAGLDAVMSQQPNAGVDAAPVQQIDYELEVQTLVKSPENDDPRWRGLVRLTATLRPRSQPTYELRCAYVAQCSADPNPPVPFDQFLTVNATAALVPYLRERISSTTQASRFPGFVMPPVNTTEFSEIAESAPQGEPTL